MSDEESKNDGAATEREATGEPGEEVASNADAQSRKSGASSIQKAPKSPRKSRRNKLYRCPPTPDEKALFTKEKSFIIDANAAASIAHEFSKTHPKLGPIIPPYNGCKDNMTNNYFKFSGVDKVVKSNEQEHGCVSTGGIYEDLFASKGYGYRYTSGRNQSGMGHSIEQISGHKEFMNNPKPMTGFYGDFGFRRNIPTLRKASSSFGECTRMAMHREQEFEEQPQQTDGQAA